MPTKAPAPDLEVVWEPIKGSSQELAIDTRCHHTLYHGTRGPGKDLEVNTPVLTDSGWKKAGEVLITDKLVALDGTYTEILGIYPKTDRDMCDVLFYDGSIVRADMEHRWLVQNNKTGWKEGWKVRTTAQMLSVKANYSVPYMQGAIPGKKWEGVDPYIVGLLLGDGTMGSDCVTLYSADDEILNYAKENEGWKIYKYGEQIGRACCTSRKIGVAKWRSLLPKVTAEFKFVPEELLKADPETRLAVLQGLMDSDGTIETCGKMRFVSLSETLARNVEYLVWSLGGNATCYKEFRPSLKGGKDWRWRVNLSHNNKFKPFRLTRKLNRVCEQKKFLTRGIKSITPVGKGNGVCFSVAHESHCFICGNWVVTHNTITQLMRFRRRVGIGYGSFWRGVIFDKEYKNFADIIAQSKRFFSKFDDGAKFISSPSDLKWVWPTGEELLFRHVKKLSDYDNFHGHEYCLEENQTIKGENGPVKIKDLKPGMKVLTHTGFKKVNAVYNLGLKECVKASIYTLDGRLHSEQLQSVDHRLLTIAGDWTQQQSQKFETVPLFVEKCDLSKASKKFQSDERPSSLASFSQPKCGESVAKLFDMQLQNNFADLFFLLLKVPFSVLLLCILSMLLRSSILFGAALGFFLPSLVRSPKTKAEQSDRRRLSILQLQVLNRLLLKVSGVLKGGLLGLQKVQDLKVRCLLDFYQCDGLAHKSIKTFLRVLPFLPDALKHTPKLPLGAMVGVGLHSRLSKFSFVHPYVKDKLCCSDLELSVGFVRFEPCGKLHCYDIEVDVENHYITCNGLTNKNCFIGWNELTKHATAELYDKLMSTNRSSFTPERDTPRKADGTFDTPDGLPLPSIPLEVFSTTNPSGPGHNWVKRRFINCAKNGEVVRIKTTVFDPKKQEDVEVTKTQVAIFGSYRENIYLPAEYIAELDRLTNSDLNLKRAWLFGDWDVTAGGAIDDLWKRDVHIVPRFPIPKEWYLDRSMDWGSSHPFSVGWWAEANGEEVVLPNGQRFCPAPGSLIQFAEWYGTAEIGTNKGLKLSASDVAEGVKAREIELMKAGWIRSQPWPGPADNQIRDVRESDVDTIEAKMAKVGIRWTESDKSPGSRRNGLQLVRDRLEAALRGEGPGLYFMSHCQASIETLPSLPRDDVKVDDVDTTAEDHVFDSLRYRILKGNNRLAKQIKVKFAT